MPIKVVQGLPVVDILVAEGVNVIQEQRALNQDIRPLRIAILNLMPRKETTETQLLRLIGGTPLQIEVDFLHTASYQSKNVSDKHLDDFYKTFDEVKDTYYDGLIITGAPVELMDFEEVAYYDELLEIIEWSESNVYSRFFICWGAQFALNHYYGIEKLLLPKKLFGVYEYEVLKPNSPYLRGFNDSYSIPESRHTTMNVEQIQEEDALETLSADASLGPDIVASKDARDLYIFGHLEYDRHTLHYEYERDQAKGRPIEQPENYYLAGDPNKKPILSWRSYAYILFSNWLNETYQNTPYEIESIPQEKRN